MSQIVIDYNKLLDSVMTLSGMEKETKYRIYPTSELVNHSAGEMAQKINELYRILIAIEDELTLIAGNTKTVLINAGIEFNEADYITSLKFDTIGEMVNSGEFNNGPL